MAHCGAATTETGHDFTAQISNPLSAFPASYFEAETKEIPPDWYLKAESTCSPAPRSAAFYDNSNCHANLYSEKPCERIIKSGSMKKLGKFNKSWKKRHFSLCTRNEELYLNYFKSDKDITPLGKVTLTGKVKVEPISQKEAGRLNAAVCDACFCIETETRRWIFCTDNAQFRKKWIDELQRRRSQFAVYSSDFNRDGDSDRKSLIEESDQKIDDLEDRSRRNTCLEIDDSKWDILSHPDHWNEFIKEFKELRLKLMKPNLLRIDSMRKVGQFKFKEICRCLRESLNKFHGKGRVMSGWLYKRGKLNTAWKKRFCVILKDGTFEYMKSPTDSSAKGRISSNDVLSVSIGLSSKDLQVFHIFTKERIWNLAAEDDQTRDSWIHVLRLSTNRIRRVSDSEMPAKDPILTRTSRSQSFSSASSRPPKSPTSMWRYHCEKNLIRIRSDSNMFSLQEGSRTNSSVSSVRSPTDQWWRTSTDTQPVHRKKISFQDVSRKTDSQSNLKVPSTRTKV